MKLKCPSCGSYNVYNLYSGECLDEDIVCGVNIVSYQCECNECDEYFDCVIHYGISDIEY